jgi:hypothetical protein
MPTSRALRKQDVILRSLRMLRSFRSGLHDQISKMKMFVIVLTEYAVKPQRHWMLLFAAMLLSGMVLSACVTAGGRQAGPVSLAVWDPEALGPMTASQEAMAQILAGKISDRFSQSPQYEIVERENLLKILDEQNLGSSGLADDQTRLRLGRIIGCRRMVFGAYQVIGDRMRLDLRLVDVSSAKVLRTAVGTASAGAVSSWMDAADQAAAELIRP